MTLEEKIMQLICIRQEKVTMPIILGLGINRFLQVSGHFYILTMDPEFRDQLQKKASEETRIGIPILLGFEVDRSTDLSFPDQVAKGF